jgi:hypothetical protein
MRVVQGRKVGVVSEVGCGEFPHAGEAVEDSQGLHAGLGQGHGLGPVGRGISELVGPARSAARMRGVDLFV